MTVTPSGPNGSSTSARKESLIGTGEALATGASPETPEAPIRATLAYLPTALTETAGLHAF